MSSGAGSRKKNPGATPKQAGSETLWAMFRSGYMENIMDPDKLCGSNDTKTPTLILACAR